MKVNPKETQEYFEGNYYDHADYLAIERQQHKGKYGKDERRKKDVNSSKTMTNLAQLEKRNSK